MLIWLGTRVTVSIFQVNLSVYNYLNQITSTKKVMFSVAFFSVCLSLNIALKVINGFWWIFQDNSTIIQATIFYILMIIWLTMLTVQFEIQSLLSKILAIFDESWIALQWYKEQMINFFAGDLEHHADSPNQESRQHEGN